MNPDVAAVPDTQRAPYLNGFLIDGSGVSDSVNLCGSLDVDVEHKVALFRLHGLRRALVHSHSMAGQSILLLQLSIQQIDGWETEQVVQQLQKYKVSQSLDQQARSLVWNLIFFLFISDLKWVRIQQ